MQISYATKPNLHTQNKSTGKTRKNTQILKSRQNDKKIHSNVCLLHFLFFFSWLFLGLSHLWMTKTNNTQMYSKGLLLIYTTQKIYFQFYFGSCFVFYDSVLFECSSVILLRCSNVHTVCFVCLFFFRVVRRCVIHFVFYI